MSLGKTFKSVGHMSELVNLNPYAVSTNPDGFSYGGHMALDMIQTARFYDTKTLKEYSPFIKNTGIIIPLTMPKIMTANFPALTAVVWKILSGHIRSWDGVGNQSLESENINMGGDGNAMKVALKTSAHSEEYTITLPCDFRGLPVVKWMRLYIEELYDTYSARGYKYNRTGLIYGQENHSMRWMVIATDPAYTFVQDASIFENAMFSEAKYDTLNIALGENSIEELAIPLTARKAPVTMAIMATAEIYLRAYSMLFDIDGVMAQVAFDPSSLGALGAKIGATKLSKEDGVSGIGDLSVEESV